MFVARVSTPRYLNPAANSLDSRIFDVARVAKPKYLAQLPMAWIPGLRVVSVPEPRYLSPVANSLDSKIARRQGT